MVVFRPNTLYSWGTTTLKPSLVWRCQPFWGTCSSNGESFLRNLFRRKKKTTPKTRKDLIFKTPILVTRNLTLKVSWVICFCWTPRNRAPKLQCFTSSFFTTSIISMTYGVSWFLSSAPWFPTTKSYLFLAFKTKTKTSVLWVFSLKYPDPWKSWYFEDPKTPLLCRFLRPLYRRVPDDS